MSDNFVSLKQMAEAKVDGVGKATIFMLSPEMIEVERGFNARPIDKTHLMSLVEALKAGATLPPVAVRVKDGRVLLVDGHHRRDAVIYGMQHGFLDTGQRIACIQYRGDDSDCITLLLTSAQGLPLTPLQAGIQYEKLANQHGLTTAQIAARIGKSVQHVADLRILASSGDAVHALVNSGKVSASTATKAVRQDRAGAADKLSKEVDKAAALGKTKATPKTMVRDPLATSGDGGHLVLSKFNLIKHIERQKAFSVETFGPGERTAGICDHIRKELTEVEAKPGDVKEWVDIILLALDGAWRVGFSASEIASALAEKQLENEGRTWPDWKTVEPGKAIEHIKGGAL